MCTNSFENICISFVSDLNERLQPCFLIILQRYLDVRREGQSSRKIFLQTLQMFIQAKGKENYLLTFSEMGEQDSQSVNGNHT